MGLDVTWYRQCQKTDHEDGADFEARNNPNYPQRSDQIEDRSFYVALASGGIACGAYSRYNRWREELAKMVGYPATGEDEFHKHSASAWAASSGPFWELINFSDCEGTIGAGPSKKLVADFRQWKPQADAIGGEFADQYAKWQHAFEQASDNGCVDFH